MPATCLLPACYLQDCGEPQELMESIRDFERGPTSMILCTVALLKVRHQGSRKLHTILTRSALIACRIILLTTIYLVEYVEGTFVLRHLYDCGNHSSLRGTLGIRSLTPHLLLWPTCSTMIFVATRAGFAWHGMSVPTHLTCRVECPELTLVSVTV